MDATPRDSVVTHVRPAVASPLKVAAKAFARLIALFVVLPVLIGYWISAAVLGRNPAFRSAVQFLSLLPGVSGQYLRRAFLQRVIGRCHHSTQIEFGVLLSEPGAMLDENVYVGPRCILGLVHLERDVLLASGVQVPSGGKQHYFDDPTRPIREQGGERRMVTIGEGAWIGTGAIVLADVGKGTIVAAGAVVTKPLPDQVIAAGVPARVVRNRFAPPAAEGDSSPDAEPQD